MTAEPTRPDVEALVQIEERIERLEEVAERWDVLGGSKRLALRARDKADGLRVARRLLTAHRPASDADVTAAVLALADEADSSSRMSGGGAVVWTDDLRAAVESAATPPEHEHECAWFPDLGEWRRIGPNGGQNVGPCPHDAPAPPEAEDGPCSACRATPEACMDMDGGCCDGCRSSGGCSHAPPPEAASGGVGGGLTDDEREALVRAIDASLNEPDHFPLRPIIERFERILAARTEQARAEATKHEARAIRLLGDVGTLTIEVEQARAEGAREALREAAEAWQWGEWTVLTAPIKAAEQPQRIIGAAQAVTDWLRARADGGDA